jgi:BlaI family transcriptional regulator, penicillinase repressor
MAVMKESTHLTDLEWDIMRVIWAEHPITSAVIIERLNAQESGWHPKTTRTLLGRLVEKQTLGYELRGRAYVYVPRVTEGECTEAASASFLERVFAGSLKPMLAHFVQQRRISKADLKELSELLEGRTEARGEAKGKKKPCK